MAELLNTFFLAFIPLFVAMDAWGILPLFIGLTEGMTLSAKNQLVTAATATCFVIALVFLATGNYIFSIMGITEADFRIAGGLVLLILAITDLVFSNSDRRRKPNSNVGIVPIGIPLIMGPAALTTILILLHRYGYGITLASLIINLLIVWVSFRYSHLVVKVLGQGGSKAIAKVMALFLAAIGVMMIRVGITSIMSG